LAAIEARNAGTMRDLALLVIGGLFALLFQQLVSHGSAIPASLVALIRRRSAQHRDGRPGDGAT
jgi:hypothetical protein